MARQVEIETIGSEFVEVNVEDILSFTPTITGQTTIILRSGQCVSTLWPLQRLLDEIDKSRSI